MSCYSHLSRLQCAKVYLWNTQEKMDRASKTIKMVWIRRTAYAYQAHFLCMSCVFGLLHIWLIHLQSKCRFRVEIDLCWISWGWDVWSTFGECTCWTYQCRELSICFAGNCLLNPCVNSLCWTPFHVVWIELTLIYVFRWMPFRQTHQILQKFVKKIS